MCNPFNIEDITAVTYEIDCCTLSFWNGTDLLCTYNLITTSIKVQQSGGYIISDGVNSALILSQDNLDDLGLTIQEIIDAAKACRCSLVEEIIEEISYSFSIELFDNQVVCTADIIQTANTALGTSYTDIVGFDFDLKPINGQSSTGFTATTSQATSSGSHGNRDFDAGGSWTIREQKLKDGTFVRLGSQCFDVATGSVAIMNVDLI